MPSRPAPAVLRDIAYHIDLAERQIAGFEPETFKRDERTLYAVARCLEIISEASRRLPSQVKQRHPSIPWRNVAAGGISTGTNTRPWTRSRCGTRCGRLCPP